jgi:Zn-dependent protease with chaperone function
MTIVLGLVAFALVVTLGAPALLAHGSWRIRHPRRAIRLWLLVLAVGVGSLLCSVVVAATMVLAKVEQHWLNGYGATVTALFAWCGLAVAGGIVALVATRAEPLAASKERSEVAVALLMARSTYRTERIGEHEVGYLDSDEVIACSTSDGRILVSGAVDDALAPLAVRAIVEHERAHVRFHHELLSRVAAVNAASFPFLAGARQFRSTVALLVELIADDEAARVCGPAAVCNALTGMASLAPDPGLELRAARLASTPVHSYPHRRRLDPASTTD